MDAFHPNSLWFVAGECYVNAKCTTEFASRINNFGKECILCMHGQWVFICMWVIYCRHKYGNTIKVHRSMCTSAPIGPNKFGLSAYALFRIMNFSNFQLFYFSFDFREFTLVFTLCPRSAWIWIAEMEELDLNRSLQFQIFKVQELGYDEWDDVNRKINIYSSWRVHYKMCGSLWGKQKNKTKQNLSFCCYYGDYYKSSLIAIVINSVFVNRNSGT